MSALLRIAISLSDIPLVNLSDQFDVIFDHTLLPIISEKPANYEDGEIHENPDGRPSTVNDICDFFVEYIHSDVLMCGYVSSSYMCTESL